MNNSAPRTNSKKDTTTKITHNKSNHLKHTAMRQPRGERDSHPNVQEDRLGVQVLRGVYVYCIFFSDDAMRIVHVPKHVDLRAEEEGGGSGVGDGSKGENRSTYDLGNPSRYDPPLKTRGYNFSFPVNILFMGTWSAGWTAQAP